MARLPGGYPLSTDSVLLAAFLKPVRARRILDLGSGAGVLCVLQCTYRQSEKLCEMHAVEILPEAAAATAYNLRLNGFDDSGAICADLREYRQLYAAGSFDLVMSNPPYFATGSGGTAPDRHRATARDERSCTLQDLCQAAGWLVRYGGAFGVVYRPERLSELFCQMCQVGIEPKRLRMVQYSASSIPSLVLVEGRRGGKPGLQVLPPLLLTDGQGHDSQEICEIYHRA